MRFVSNYAPITKVIAKGCFYSHLRLLEVMLEDDKRIMMQTAYDTKSYHLLQQIWDALIYVHKKPEADRYEKYLEDRTTQRNLAASYQALNTFNISSMHNGLTEGNNKIATIDIPIMIAWGEND